MPASGVGIPVTAGAKVSTPDSAALSISGDFDIQVKVAMDDWTPSSIRGLVEHNDAAATDYSYQFYLFTDGKPGIQWTSDGSTLLGANSTAATGVSDGATKWLRVTHDVDNGSGGNDVKFYTSDDGASWSQLGSTVTQAFTTSHFNSTQPVRLGSTSGDERGIAGTMYRARILNGIAGTTVADIDFVNHPAGSATVIRDAYGVIWTIGGAAALTSYVKPTVVGIAS